MENFEYRNPTKLIFGDGQVSKITDELKALDAKKVMLVFGGGSIKRNGVYDDVTRELSAAGIEYVECDGVEPNPRIETAERGIKIAREAGVDALLALRWRFSHRLYETDCCRYPVRRRSMGSRHRESNTKNGHPVRNSLDTCCNRFRNELRLGHHELEDTRKIRLGQPVNIPDILSP